MRSSDSEEAEEVGPETYSEDGGIVQEKSKEAEEV